ncbi:serine hydrolase domain-containing protein [Williamsia soli]|uniref:serine hydrolase domain-containing protein n=1 Tax=Williamsia soli TaxID=364929 RepID=UPI001A9ECE2E|nr:serine hydrolase domain-containing protein [Williamsia soli]
MSALAISAAMAVGLSITAAPAAAELDLPAAVDELILDTVGDGNLRSAIVQVRVNGTVVADLAFGEAAPGVPATTRDHFRNGAIAITYTSALLVELDKRGIVGFDEPISTWRPDLPYADKVTPRQLASMTAGYPDYVTDESFTEQNLADVYKNWTPDELLSFSFAQERIFEPGTEFGYSHSNYVILGLVLEKATGTPLADLLRTYISNPLGLSETVSNQGPAIPAPALHGFSTDRGAYEDTIDWNPSWTIANGSVQTTTIDDAASSFDALLGSSRFLGEDGYRELTDQGLAGLPFGAGTLTTARSYGLGVFVNNDWFYANPFFNGYTSTVLTLPAHRSKIGTVTIAVAATPTEKGTQEGNIAYPLATDIAALIAPDHPIA